MSFQSIGAVCVIYASYSPAIRMTAHCAVKVRLFIDILSHIITTSHKTLSLESISLRSANHPPIFVTYCLQTKPNYGVYDFNTNNHKRPRIAINNVSSI